MPKRSSTPTEENDLANWIVDQFTIEAKAQPGKNPPAVTSSRKGGLKGRKARAATLSAAERKALAKKATQTHWQK